MGNPAYASGLPALSGLVSNICRLAKDCNNTWILTGVCDRSYLPLIKAIVLLLPALDILLISTQCWRWVSPHNFTRAR